MDLWKWILFSFSGRITRMYFWLGVLIIWVVELVFFGLGTAIFGFSVDPSGSFNFGGASFIGMLLGMVLMIVLIWVGLAVSVKRWHDRAKSGWWVLIGLIPLIGAIWVLVECGFLSGTDGVNQYGTANVPPTDPLAG